MHNVCICNMFIFLFTLVIFENVNNEPLEETSEINGYQSLIVMGHELNPLQFGRNNFSNPDGKN